MRISDWSSDVCSSDLRTMIDRQIVSLGIKSPHVLAAMRNVPREAFLPDELAEFAYEDSALPIEAGQTISQPYIVALMIDAAGIEPGDTVLEIGAGSGSAAALLGQIAEKEIGRAARRERGC